MLVHSPTSSPTVWGGAKQNLEMEILPPDHCSPLESAVVVPVLIVHAMVTRFLCVFEYLLLDGFRGRVSVALQQPGRDVRKASGESQRAADT